VIHRNALQDEPALASANLLAQERRLVQDLWHGLMEA
jgi:hypothetical protein